MGEGETDRVDHHDQPKSLAEVVQTQKVNDDDEQQVLAGTPAKAEQHTEHHQPPEVTVETETAGERTIEDGISGDSMSRSGLAVRRYRPVVSGRRRFDSLLRLSSLCKKCPYV